MRKITYTHKQCFSPDESTIVPNSISKRDCEVVAISTNKYKEHDIETDLIIYYF